MKRWRKTEKFVLPRKLEIDDGGNLKAFGRMDGARSLHRDECAESV